MISLRCRAGKFFDTEDTLHGKILAWSDKSRRQSKRIKDLGDIARLVESHPALWETLPTELKDQVDRPE